MRVSFYTLGCKVNQNETGALAQLFESKRLHRRRRRRRGRRLYCQQLYRHKFSAIKKAGNGFAAKKENTPAP